MATNKEFEARLKQLEEELKLQRELTEQYREQLSARDDDEDDIDELEKVVLLNDPYQSQNPFKIHGEIEACDEYPSGAVLRWISPTYRERRTWRGWVPMQYGDEYTGENGELLNRYIPDPPPILANQPDSYVRRGDVILGRIDKRIWESRQAQRLLESRKRMGKATSKARTVLGDGIELFGPGATPSRRPRGGFRPEQERAPSGRATVTGGGHSEEV